MTELVYLGAFFLLLLVEEWRYVRAERRHKDTVKELLQANRKLVNTCTSKTVSDYWNMEQADARVRQQEGTAPYNGNGRLPLEEAPPPTQEELIEEEIARMANESGVEM